MVAPMARRQDPLVKKPAKRRRVQEGTLVEGVQQIRFHDRTPSVALRGFITDYPLVIASLPVVPAANDFYHVLPADLDQKDDTLVLKPNFVGEPKP